MAKINGKTCRLLSSGKGENPKLYARAISGGVESLYLEYYYGYSREGGKVKANRHKEPLKLYLITNPRTPLERTQNKETLEIARRVRFERGQQLLEQREGYRLRNDVSDFIEYYQWYADNYTKKDKPMLVLALRKFVDYLHSVPDYHVFRQGIKPSQITRDMMCGYVDYLKGICRGEGARTLFQRFKKVVKYAVERNVMNTNPCRGLSITVDTSTLNKDILSMEEIARLAATHYRQENPTIRAAFMFCLYCGMRLCDVKGLTYSNIDYSNKLMTYEQSKTKGHSKYSKVVIPLNDTLLSLVGSGDKEEKIFPLPTHQTCNQALSRWVKRAGIDKHITWHCARHSFAVNILNNGANIKTVASLLGHSGLQHTEKYTRAVDKLKEDAINSLPPIAIE